MISQYIEQHGKRLYGLCMTLCANTFDADDLYQETWLKVCKKIQLYDQDREFGNWLSQICVNTYRDRLRRKKLSPIFDLFESSEIKDAEMENIIREEKEDYSDLHDAINKLPYKLRTTVILHYFNDMDLKTTASVLKIPVGTVKSRMNKAKKLLKEMLPDEADL